MNMGGGDDEGSTVSKKKTYPNIGRAVLSSRANALLSKYLQQVNFPLSIFYEENKKYDPTSLYTLQIRGLNQSNLIL